MPGGFEALDVLRVVAAAAGHVVLDDADLAATVGDRLGRASLERVERARGLGAVLGTTRVTPRAIASWHR
jgi:hypothetical protein